MEETWLYCDDDSFVDCNEYSSKEDAIAGAMEDEDIEESFFIGRKVPAKISPLRIDIDKMLERVAEDTTYGLDISMDIDYSDFLENVSEEHKNELKKEMNRTFLKWLYKNGYEPRWFEIEDIEIIER